MNDTSDAQFLPLHFRLFDDPAFCSFMRSAAFPLYLLLRRYVWRAEHQRHPVEKVNELYDRGYLVCAVPRRKLAEKLGVREASQVSRQLADLEERGIVRRVRTGRENVYVLGRWHAKRHGRTRETFFLEQRGLVRDTSDVACRDTSDVYRHDTSDVSFSTPINKEENREANYVARYEPLYVRH